MAWNRGARDSGGNRPPPQMGKLSDTRIAWVDLPKHQVILFQGTDDGELLEADGSEPIKLLIRNGSTANTRQAMAFMLTSYTVEELKAFKSIMDKAVEVAMPIAAQLDQLAKEAFENGDDTFARLYRTVPVLHERIRKSDKHRDGLRDGPEDAPNGDWPAGVDADAGDEHGSVSD